MHVWIYFFNMRKKVMILSHQQSEESLKSLFFSPKYNKELSVYFGREFTDLMKKKYLSIQFFISRFVSDSGENLGVG